VLLAVRVGLPAVVSLYLKLAVLELVGMVTAVMVVVSPVSRTTPPADVVDRFTVVGEPFTGLPLEA
jgi:hypothetical protein